MNIIVFMAVVVVLMVLAWLVIDLAMAEFGSPSKLIGILKILTLIGGAVAVCHRVGWI